MPTDIRKTIPVDIFSVDEPWAYARLSDGSMVKAKVVFMEIRRVIEDDGKPAFNEDGAPLFAVGTQTVVQGMSKDAVDAMNIKTIGKN